MFFSFANSPPHMWRILLPWGACEPRRILGEIFSWTVTTFFLARTRKCLQPPLSCSSGKLFQCCCSFGMVVCASMEARGRNLRISMGCGGCQDICSSPSGFFLFIFSSGTRSVPCVRACVVRISGDVIMTHWRMFAGFMFVPACLARQREKKFHLYVLLEMFMPRRKKKMKLEDFVIHSVRVTSKKCLIRAFSRIKISFLLMECTLNNG